MHLPLSRAVAQSLDVLPEVGSTNVELAARASVHSVTHFAVVMTTNQTAGKGRLGRTWVAPPGKTLAVSVLLALPETLEAHREGEHSQRLSDRVGWLPLIAGLAMTRAVASLVSGHRVTVKWPNDVQVDGLKVSGLLAHLVPGVGVVIGAGLNLTMTADELPTPVSTSLTLVGAREEGIVDAALSAYITELRRLYDGFVDGSLDVRAAVSAQCSTIGESVRVELPGGDELYGKAESIDEFGRLVVRERGGVLHSVAAGDVTHVRYD